MGTHMLSTWIKSITGHNNLAYFQSKLNPEIDPTCRLCLQANETLHHLMTDCEATTSLQMDIKPNPTTRYDLVSKRHKQIYTAPANPLIDDIIQHTIQQQRN